MPRIFMVLVLAVAVSNAAPSRKAHTKRQAPDFLNFPPLPYYQGNSFYQQFPPHNYHPQPPFKQNYQSLYQPQPDFSPYLNDIHFRNQPSPFIPDYPSYQFPIPQYDDNYQDLDAFNKAPAFRGPIQIIPSRFPQPIENLVERIQNYFSVYNPPIGGVIISEIPLSNTVNNATETPVIVRTEAPSPSSTSTESTADNSAEVDSAPSNNEEEAVTTEASNVNDVSSTESVTETEAEITTEFTEKPMEETTATPSS